MFSDSSRPLDVLVARLDGVHGSPPKLRARCPSHGSRGASLALAEGNDGTVVVRCHAGCDAADVVHAIGLELRDLFPARTPAQARDREELVVREREAFNREPAAYLRGALRRELARIQDDRARRLGFRPPLRSTEVDRARRRVALLVGLSTREVPAAIGWPMRAHGITTQPALWEWAPHDEDPRWPAIFDGALEYELAQIRKVVPGFDLNGIDPWLVVPAMLTRAALRAAATLSRTSRASDRRPA